MPRDYKHRSPKPAAPKPPPRRDLWFAVGLFTGITLAVAWSYRIELWDHAFHSVSSPQKKSATKKPIIKQPASPKRPRFEFYTLLPEMEVVVQEQAVTPRVKVDKRADKGRYVIQAGSFRKQAEADGLKAKLALVGLEAEIQTVAIDGHAKWHRVRLGPYQGLTAVDAARSRLKEHKIAGIVLKVKE